MSNASPTLLRLFERSRYITRHRPLDEDDESPEAEKKRQKKREERERWAVAALGHVLAHDKEFREEFWRCVCCQGDQETPHDINVTVEPQNSADLCLKASCENRTIVCVIEAKVGAPLKSHQNPDKEEFLNAPNGYGKALLREASSNANSALRYVVLGYRGEPLQLRMNPLDTQPQIQVLQHDWSVVASIVAQSGLVVDLFRTLAAIGLHIFSMKDLKLIGLTSHGIVEAAQAHAVLTGVVESLGLEERAWKQVSVTYNSTTTGFEFGIYLSNKGRKSQFHQRLMGITKKAEDECIAWFGFVSDGDDCTRREVWFHCDTQTNADKIRDRLGPKATLSPEEGKPDQFNVAYSEPIGGEPKDLDFFLNALRRAIGE